MDQLANWISARRRQLVFASIVIIIVLSAGASGLEVSNDPDAYYDQDAKIYKDWQHFSDTFTKEELMIIGVKADDGSIFQPHHLKMLLELTLDSWQLPYALRVDSLTNHLLTTGSADALDIEEAIQSDTLADLDSDKIAQLRQQLLADPQISKRLIDDTGEYAAIVVRLEANDKQDVILRTASAAFTKFVAEAEEKYPKATFHLTGSGMIGATFELASRQDMSSLIPLMFVVVIFVLWIFFGQIAAIIGTCIVIGLSTAATMGVVGWFGVPITPPVAVIPIVVLTVAIADSVHLLRGMLIRLQEGATTENALMDSLRSNLKPMAFTSITTAIGFLGLNFAENPPFRHMGTFSAVGCILAFLITVTVLPTIMLLLPKGRIRQNDWAGRYVERLGQFVVANPRWCTFGGLGFAISLSACLFTLKFNSSVLEYFSDDFKFRRDADSYVEHMGGFNTIEYEVSAPEGKTIFDPEYLKALDGFEIDLEGLEQVRYVNSVVKILKDLNRAVNEESEAHYKVPEEEAEAGQLVMLYELSVPAGRDLTTIVDISKTVARVSVGVTEMNDRALLELIDRIENLSKKHTGAFVLSSATGRYAMNAHMTTDNIRSNLMGGIISYGLITLLIIALFGSLQVGVLSILPNIFPSLMALGIWSLTYETIGLAGTLVFTLTIGIIVDDTIHFFSHYVRNRKQGHAKPEAIIRSFRHVGRAITDTSIALAAGFAVLSFSPFAGNRDVGMMCMFSVGFALFCDLIILPGVLLLNPFDKFGKQAAPAK